MTVTVLSTAAFLVLAALVAWRLGGLLRFAGGFLGIGGLLATASRGTPLMALSAVIGLPLWLAGHWLWALREHYYRSPLARRIFLTLLPEQLDPTRGWGAPTIPPGARR